MGLTLFISFNTNYDDDSNDDSNDEMIVMMTMKPCSLKIFGAVDSPNNTVGLNLLIASSSGKPSGRS